jgi:hypothetical protein
MNGGGSDGPTLFEGLLRGVGMMIRFQTISACLLLLMASRANADALSAKDLRDICGSAQASDVVKCSVYFDGFTDGASMMFVAILAKKPFCFAKGTPSEAVKKAFVQGLAKYPNLLDRDAATAVAVTSSFAFPCSFKE